MARHFGVNGADALKSRASNHRFSGEAGSNGLVTSERNGGSRASDGNAHAVALIFGLPLVCAYSRNHAEEMVSSYVSHRPAMPFLVTFVNPFAVKLVGSDPAYRANLHRMDLVFCDGIALVWAARRIAHRSIERVSFDSTGIAPSVFSIAQEHGRTIALVGGRGGVAKAAAARIRENFPRLRIVSAVDGYRTSEDLIRTIIGVDPDIVVCGMGAPLQEAFLMALAGAGWSGAGFTCGGYLDHLVDRFDFYPSVINRLNLRWLYRLAREPRRIGYRVVVEYAPFWRAIGWEFLCGALPIQRRGRRS
jgi:N-acetylglucosaminyldiphosphoundecaprenol N-acetyl-beta-D-mannosaminyltransferase